jgi:hypothetical protein
MARYHGYTRKRKPGKRKKKGAAFKVRTPHTDANPQICGLHEQTGCSHFQEDEMAFYLVCQGNEASTASQVLHCECAKRLGYNVPDFETTAAKGKRTRGTEHTVGEAPDALTALAEAFTAAENEEKARGEAFPDSVGDVSAPPAPPLAPLP